MRKWDIEIFNRNHLRLMRFHIGMAAFYGCICALVIALWDRTVSTASIALTFGCFALPALLHIALAYGSYKRIELSRKASEIVFALLIFAFPIGTFLSLFWFLPATVWKFPDESKS